MTLSQLGAQVIRVDPIGGASDVQRWPLAADGTSIYWTGLNKGKRSATIDLRSAEGQELVQRLIVEGDGIVVTNAVLPSLSHELLAAETFRRHPRPAARPRRWIHRGGLHRERGNRIPPRHRSRRSRGPDQPRAARLGRRAAACTPRWPSSPPSTAATSPGSGARVSIALEDVALGDGGQPGIADRAAGDRDATRAAGQLDLRPVRPGLRQSGRGQVHGCPVDRTPLSRPGRRDGHRRRRCRRSPRRWAWTSAPRATATGTATSLSGLFATWFADHTGRRDHRGAVGHHRAVRAVPHLRGGGRRPRK